MTATYKSAQAESDDQYLFAAEGRMGHMRHLLLTVKHTCGYTPSDRADPKTWCKEPAVIGYAIATYDSQLETVDTCIELYCAEHNPARQALEFKQSLLQAEMSKLEAQLAAIRKLLE